MSRHFDDLDAVLEFDAVDDFGRLIFHPSIVAMFLQRRMSLAVFADRALFVRTVRCRTVANTLSTVLKPAARGRAPPAPWTRSAPAAPKAQRERRRDHR